MNNLLEKIKNLTQYIAPAAAAAAAGIATGAVQGGIGISSMIANTIQNYQARKLNEEVAKENLQYQRWLNNIIMDREDTAIQRRQADLAAAGINPLLAGIDGAGAGGTMQTINPIMQDPVKIEGEQAIQGLEGLRNNTIEIAKIRSNEDIAKDTGILKEKEIANNLRIAENEIRASNMREDKKNETLAEIAYYQTLMDYKMKLMMAQNENEQKKLDRQLQEMIAYHDWTKSLIKTGIKPIDTAIEQAYNAVRGEEEEKKLQDLGPGQSMAQEGEKFEKDENGYYRIWNPPFKGQKPIKVYVKEDNEGRQYYQKGIIKYYLWRKDRVNLKDKK